MSLPALEIAEGPHHGAHRLTVTAAAPAERWAEVAGRLAVDLTDAERAAAWDPTARLDLAGWSSAPAEARFYLAGSVVHWVALSSHGFPVSPLAHAALVLGRPIAALRLDRRALAMPTYAQITGREQPFAADGPVLARRVTVVAPRLDDGQLLGLCELLRPALRREAWNRGELPGDARPVREGEAIVLPESLPTGALLEVVHVWTQVFWVDVESVRWTA